MSPQQIAEAIADLKDERYTRHRFQEVATTESGRYVLAWIIARCGNWSMQAETVVPELIALGNQIFAALGVLHTDRTGEELVRALAAIADERDLAARERLLMEVEKDVDT